MLAQKPLNGMVGGRPALNSSRLGLQTCCRPWHRASRSPHIAAATKDDKEEEMMLDPAARALAGATVLGLAGTVAVVGAQLTGINMFRAVTWNPADFQVAFVALAPVTLLELFLFGLEHKVPQEFWQAVPAGGAATSSSNGSSSSPSRSRVLDLDAVQAAGWSPAVLQLTLALYRDVQLGVITASSLPPLPLPYEATLLVAREASKEVLQRGFLLAALAGWITDRMYEAGIDDMIQLQSLVKGSVTGDTLTVPLVGSWLSAWLIASIFSPAAVAVAQENLVQVSSAMLSLAGLKADGSSIQLESVGTSSSTSSSSSSSSSPASSSSSSQEAASGSNGATSTSGSSSSLGSKVPVKEVVVVEAEGEPSSSLTPSSQRMLQEYLTISKAEQVSESPAAVAAYWISLTRQLMRIVAANSAFVVTGGNLGATFAAGSLSGLLVVLYGRLARSRAAAGAKL